MHMLISSLLNTKKDLLQSSGIISVKPCSLILCPPNSKCFGLTELLTLSPQYKFLPDSARFFLQVSKVRQSQSLIHLFLIFHRTLSFVVNGIYI